MCPHVRITKPERPIRARVVLPRSKSMANRALIAAALAGDLSCINDPGDADDTRILHALLRDRPPVMHAGLGGTTFRFLLAWAAVQEGQEHHITGDPALLERPHTPLIDALRALGARIQHTEEGYRIHGSQVPGGEVAFDAPISSQYLSALMLIAPYFTNGLRIRWNGVQLSRPYVEMTARVMRHFGAQVDVGDTLINVKPGRYAAKPFHVPPDWSAAAFWYEVVALADDADVELIGLHRTGEQGDEAVLDLFAPLVTSEANADGIRLSRTIEAGSDSVRIDLSATPDLFQPLAFSYAFSEIRWAFSGLTNLAVKESDRIAAVQQALLRFGVATERDDARATFRLATDRTIGSSEGTHPVHGDHRMAMALAPLALVFGAITIADPDVVSKSYPGFWKDLRQAGFGVAEQE